MTPRNTRKKKREEDTRIERRRQQVATLLLRGLRPYQIATTLSVARSTVCKDEQALRADWQKQAAGDYDALKAEELEKLRNIEAECFIEMQSAKDNNRFSSARGWLDRVFRCIERRAKLLGYDAPLRTDMTTGGQPVDFGECLIVDFDDDPA